MKVTFDRLRVEGTLPFERLGYVFAYQHFGPMHEEEFRLLSGEILAAPWGDPIASKADPLGEGNNIQGDISVLGSRYGWRFVEVVSSDGNIVVRGYVEAARLSTPDTDSDFVASPYGSTYESSPPEPEYGARLLARGTRLLSEDGVVLGLIGWPSYFPDCDGNRVAVPTHWGPMVFQVEEPAAPASSR
ncbi:MAG: hypothetical protein JKY37_00150 [Nannocystaceae bacterium]|nr:hypothetical protein [Nannocystaceae bacterium]